MTCGIGEVADRFNISCATLRTWEKLGYIPKPLRTGTNRRRYSEEHISKIKNFIEGRK